MTNAEMIRNIAVPVGGAALRSGQGLLNSSSTDPIQSRFEIEGVRTLSKPKEGSWSGMVDKVEAEFAPEYDKEEYKNSALALMALVEMRMALRALGVPTLRQTDYRGRPLTGSRTLDVGCGTGRVIMPLIALGSEVTAFDATAEYVAIARLKAQEQIGPLDGSLLEQLVLYQSLAEEYPYPTKEFDVITCLFGVLNHVEKWKETIGKMAGAIRSNGMLIISMYGPNNALVFDLMKRGGLEYQPSLAQKRTEGGIVLGDSSDVLPANFPNPTEIAKVLVGNDLEIVKRVGFLRIAALFPQDPTPENLEKYKLLVNEVDPRAFVVISQQTAPEAILLSAFLYDQATQDPNDIDGFAYCMFVCKKKGENNEKS